ncbi:MAG: alpha/beta hydrolase [Myxococcales bacterium]|nr:alpha/beta hydrolase [Myxococcales bacterium]
MARSARVAWTARAFAAMLARMRAHERHRKAAVLARWLGPWAAENATPPGIRCETIELRTATGPVALRRYEPTSGRASGVYVVVQGLHYAGPADPRLDRFCRVLAAAGLVVFAPFVRPYLELTLAPEAELDVAAAVAHAVGFASERGLPRPALFTLSFGTPLAVRVAASAEHATSLGALVLFGGFADFTTTLRFILGRRAFRDERELTLRHDPLNAPAAFVNLVRHLPREREPAPLERAWLEMARRTWGRLELRPRARREPIADALAVTLEPEDRELFRVGCGLAPGGPALLEVALARAGDHFAFIDPRPHLPRVRAPVLVAHGRDDDVIPYPQSCALFALLGKTHPKKLALTGLFGHTGAMLPAPSAALAELDLARELLYALVDAAHERLGVA